MGQISFFNKPSKIKEEDSRRYLQKAPSTAVKFSTEVSFQILGLLQFFSRSVIDNRVHFSSNVCYWQQSFPNN